MAPSSASSALSPAELSYLHTSLSLSPPIRPDCRTPTQFRPLYAETSILPGCNGSARIGFADGTEAVVGIKAEVERSKAVSYHRGEGEEGLGTGSVGVQDRDEDEENEGVRKAPSGQTGWVEMSIEIPGFRDDDALAVFLSQMLTEALLARGKSEGSLEERLVINGGWHWRIYIDILLLSPPLSYPLPLLSLTTHLALLSTRLPKLKSEGEEDPLFDDDWEASEYLYGRSKGKTQQERILRPPITLLVIAVGENTIFDPSKEEIAVAEAVLAVSVSGSRSGSRSGSDSEGGLRLLSIRTIDPPSRLTQPGVPNTENPATSGTGAPMVEKDNANTLQSVWRPPRGGVKRAVMAKMVKMVLEKGGVGEDVLEGLDAVDIG